MGRADGPSEVETDANGIDASSLRALLENWPKDKPKPKVLYTVPVSQHGAAKAVAHR